MIAYFARRIVGGVVTLFVAGLVLYSLVMYMPGGLLYPEQPRLILRGKLSQEGLMFYKELRQQTARMWEIDKPWPVNYLAWLFNPDETTEIVFVEPGSKVEDMFGVAMLIIILTLPSLMAVVVVQRRKRQPRYGLPNYPQSRKLLGQYLHPMRMSGI